MIELSSEMTPDPASQAPPDCVLPAGDVFLADDPAPAQSDPSPDVIAGAPRPDTAHPPGPGIWESIAWMIGMIVVQLGTTVLTVGVLFFGSILMEEIDPALAGPTDVASKLLWILQDGLLVILGVSQGATIIYGLLAIRLRIGPLGIRRLGWRLPWRVHWLLVGLLMPPMWLLSSSLLNALLKWMPWGEASMKSMLDSFAGAPVWLGLLVIGMGPAVAEELVFRGLIGRGLVARRGLVPGMLITSLLFGVMHVQPVQAIGVIPLGLTMHFAYFTTRSFWAPMTLHFLNNSLSVLWVKLGAEGTRLDQLVEAESDLPLPILIVSIAMATSIALLLWQTRVQHFLPDGSAWNPGYIATETPPPGVGAVATRRRASPLALAATVVSTLGFATALWIFARG